MATKRKSSGTSVFKNANLINVNDDKARLASLVDPSTGKLDNSVYDKASPALTKEDKKRIAKESAIPELQEVLGKAAYNKFANWLADWYLCGYDNLCYPIRLEASKARQEAYNKAHGKDKTASTNDDEVETLRSEVDTLKALIVKMSEKLEVEA